MVFALCLMVAGIVALTIGRRGDGRRDLRRCPRCWYAMSHTPGVTCPECGYAAADERALHRPRRRRWLELAGVVLMVGGIGVFFTGPASRPWTSRIPTPVLRVMLNFMYEVNQPASGLPTPARALMGSKDPLERARWHHTTAIAFETWIEEVTTPTGPITDAELATLAILADQANQLYADYGGTSHNEIRLIDSVTDRLARRWRNAREAQSPDPHRVTRLEWALAELQFRGGGYSHRPDWALPPTEVVGQALAHADPSVRMFGLSRAGRIAHVAVMETKNEAAREALAILTEQINTVAASDPDDAVRGRAEDLLTYLERFVRDPSGGD